jgi:hypothetical protein
VQFSAAGDGGARALRVWGHAAADLLCGVIVVTIGLRFYVPPPMLGLTVAVALVAFVLACWVAMRRHDRSLCEYCVAALPLDATERAARYRMRFRVAHAGGERRLVFPYLAVLVLVNFAPGTWGRLVWIMVQLSLVYLLRCAVTHRQLQPWCPWCRGGGEKDPANTDPLPDDHRQLV